MVTVGIATLKEREQSFRKTIESIYDQADVIYVVLNHYPEIPLWVRLLPKIKAQTGFNTLGASGKLLCAHRIPEGVYFGIDDDLLYPKGYCEMMIEGIERYKCIVTLHGKNFANRPIGHYRKDFTQNIQCLGELKDDAEVDVCGSGCVAFDISQFKLSINNFRYPNMVDVELSREAHKQGVKMVALAHQRNYLHYMKPVGETVWSMSKDDTIQTQIVNSFLK
jgi:hypothetical protein